MLQKEFALRCTGSESSTSYGKLSVICNYLYEMEILKEIDKSYFSPKPKVDSSLLIFRPKKNFFKVKKKDTKIYKYLSNKQKTNHKSNIKQ